MSCENKCAMNYSITKKIGTTRTTTSRTQSRTPMTTLTQCTCTWTIAWRTCTESARIAHCSTVGDDHMHTSWLKFWALFTTIIHGHPHGAFSLIRPSPLSAVSSSSCLSPSSSTTSSCSLSSSARRTWQTCAAPRRTRVRTPWTSPTLRQVMSPRHMTSTSSTTHQHPSPSWSLPRTKTWMTWHSARCSLRHTEDKSTTAYQVACQSVSQSVVVVCCVRWIRATWWRERNVDQSVNFGVVRNTYSAHSKFSENTRTEKMVDRSGQLDERNSSNAQNRTLFEEQRHTTIAEYRE